MARTSEIEAPGECTATAWHRANEVGLVPATARRGSLRRRRRDLLLFDLEDRGKTRDAVGRVLATAGAAWVLWCTGYARWRVRKCFDGILMLLLRGGIVGIGVGGEGVVCALVLLLLLGGGLAEGDGATCLHVGRYGLVAADSLGGGLSVGVALGAVVAGAWTGDCLWLGCHCGEEVEVGGRGGGGGGGEGGVEVCGHGWELGV